MVLTTTNSGIKQNTLKVVSSTSSIRDFVKVLYLKRFCESNSKYKNHAFLILFRPELIKCLSESEKVIEDLLRVDSLEWPLLSSQEVLTELLTTHSLRKQFEDKLKKVII